MLTHAAVTRDRDLKHVQQVDAAAALAGALEEYVQFSAIK